MAYDHPPSGTGSTSSPPHGSYSMLPTIDPRIQESEDQDEWEYEYSVTETETYYVTLDLTSPAIEPRRRPKPAINQEDPRIKWKNHGITSQRRDRPPSPKIYRYNEDDEDEGSETSAANARGDARGDNREQENQPIVSPMKGGKGGMAHDMDGNEEEEEEGVKDEDIEAEGKEGRGRDDSRPASVQILDLHSENPIVSYAGHVFSCEWASNIGTELLFATHDDNNPQPVLRSLPGDIDLLAASSCRLVSKSATLEPKIADRSRLTNDLRPRIAPRGDDAAISLTVGHGASQRRKEQARFLDNLMSIKRDKGDADQVTVIAQKRHLNNKWKGIWQRRRQAERTRLARVAKTKTNTSLAQLRAETANARLKQMDEEDKAMKVRVQPKASAIIADSEDLLKKRGRKRKPVLEVDHEGVPVAATMQGEGGSWEGSGFAEDGMAEDGMDEDMAEEEYDDGEEMEGYGQGDDGFDDGLGDALNE